MEDLNKNAKTEKPVETQNASKKVTAENAPKVPVKRIRVRAKTNPTPAIVAKSTPVATAKISPPKVESPQAAKPIIKKEVNTETENLVTKSPKNEKAESAPKVKNVVLVLAKEEKGKPESGKKEIKVIKKKTKKAEEKVDKLKKKVKKAKKKEVKKSKIKDLKDKLGKALKKFKTSIEKLKKEKK